VLENSTSPEPSETGPLRKASWHVSQPPIHALYPTGMFQSTQQLPLHRKQLMQGEVKAEPFKGRVAAVTLISRRGICSTLRTWASRSHEEHTADLEFKFTPKPQHQGHSSSGFMMQNSQETC